MKKLTILFAIFISVLSYSQASSKVNNAQNFNQSVSNPFNLVGANPPPDGQWQLYIKDDIKWETNNINGLASYIQTFLLWNNIIGKPNFATVATSGSYNDLLNKPTIPSPQVNSDWNSVSGISQILNKPTLSTVATTGSYNDLSNKPTIPPAQVNSDWNSISGISQILNKPSIYSFTGLGTQYTKGDGTYATFPTTVSSFTNDANYITSSSLNSTLSNYVTNTSLTSTLTGYATTGGLAAGLATKENIITAGTTSQYWRGDKTWQTLNTSIVPESTNLYYTDTRARASNSAGTGITYNATTGVITNSAPDQTVAITGVGSSTVTGTYPNFTISSPVAKRQLTFTGTTDVSGNYNITFSPAFSVAPNIQASITNQGSNTNQFIKVVSSSTTGATVNVFQRNAVTLLGIEVLLAATTNVSGATVDILITEK